MFCFVESNSGFAFVFPFFFLSQIGDHVWEEQYKEQQDMHWVTAVGTGAAFVARCVCWCAGVDATYCRGATRRDAAGCVCLSGRRCRGKQAAERIVPAGCARRALAALIADAYRAGKVCAPARLDSTPLARLDPVRPWPPAPLVPPLAPQGSGPGGCG